MTDSDWLRCRDVAQMLTYLAGRISPRKLRLFGVACCQSVWPLLIDRRSRHAVKVGGRFADGEAGESERRQAHAAARQASLDADDRSEVRSPAETAGVLAALAAAGTLPIYRTASDVALVAQLVCRARALVDAPRGSPPLSGSPRERHRQAALLRDIAGPLSPPVIAPSWKTPLVLAIAEGAYAARDWIALPVLADALEDAGCGDEELLGHCRSSGEHARGCWAVDALLGKK